MGREVGDESTSTVCDVQDPPLSHVVHRPTKVFPERYSSIESQGDKVHSAEQRRVNSRHKTTVLTTT